MSYAEPILGGMFVVRPEPLVYERGGERGITLISDLHIGAPNVNYKKIQTDIETAIVNNDRILINGDVFDMILPGDRKRFTPDALHPRLQGKKNIINEVVKWGAEILAPAAHLIDMIGVGNHEVSVEKYHHYDPTSALLDQLYTALPVKHKDHKINFGGYTGYIDYRFRLSLDENLGNGRRYVIWYHHGSGGSSPVTKGMIDLDRTAAFRADLKWLGHKHTRITAHIQELECPLFGDEPNILDVRQVITGAYFDTYRGQTQQSYKDNGRRANYAADMGCRPQGQGGARVVISFANHNNITPHYEVKIIQ